MASEKAKKIDSLLKDIDLNIAKTEKRIQGAAQSLNLLSQNYVSPVNLDEANMPQVSDISSAHKSVLLEEIETYTKENEKILKDISKSDYRIVHLLRYINQLEKDIEKNQYKLKYEKSEYRIKHLLAYIDTLEAGAPPSKPSSPSPAPRTDAGSSTTQPKRTEKKPNERANTTSPSAHPPPQVVREDVSFGGVRFSWPYGGESVLVAGSFTQWTERNANQTFTLKDGTYYYKFKVDGQWKHDPSKPTTDDNHGGFNNILTITSTRT
eukprot:TRINITY_DN2288_c0_g1_i1.p1 TRINITY_DN2288_c0_g1~~TRINITY_DN2288_c0_g1_i1.p1  ORF type:complete len:279 (+),score=66.87 TRINITY_DN2288_c0_g1_i1:40-837(+)